MFVAGCAVEPAVTVGVAQQSDATFDPTDDPFGWTPFSADPHVEIGTFTVPLDYADPAKGRFELNIARHRALKPDQRIGSLLINPGGPGFGGSDFAVFAEQNFGQPLLDRFDIVAWDPRGTGASKPKIDCIDDYDRFYAAGDVTPDDETERQQLIDLAKAFAAVCADQNAEYLQYVGTNNSARDIDAIRAALGEATISYLGFSYGSELGATWATLFPSTLRAAVLDGAVDPAASAVESGLQQLKGFEDALTTFLATCSADPKCAFHNDGDAEGAFDRLMRSLDATPVPSRVDRPPVAVRSRWQESARRCTPTRPGRSWPAPWPRRRTGDGIGLLDLYDRYYVRLADGTYDDSLEAFQVISCMDTLERPTVAQADAEVPKLQAAAPRFAISTVGDYSCTDFPPATDPRIEITGTGAGPIVVVGTTGDAATPLDGTRKMAAALEDGRLVVVVGNQHTGYGVNDCSSAAVEEYLIDPVGHLPTDGLRCG